MNCYFHPKAEGVVTCGKCGVAMCKECEENAFFRSDRGTGQALCNRCSLTEAQANVNFKSSWLKKRMIRIILTSLFVIGGIIAFLVTKGGYGFANMFVCWFIAGLVVNIGNQKVPKSVESQVRDAVNEYRYPVSTMIGKIIGTTLFAPIFLLTNLIGYFQTYIQYKKDLKVLETIKESLN